MKKAIHPNTPYGKGSTEFHTAFPAQQSDGRSGGVPLKENPLPLRKPAVLATMFPEPSQGTPGTAISAEPINTGTTPSRTRRNGLSWITSGLECMQARLYRKYLALELLAVTHCLIFRYLRFVIWLIDISRTQVFHAKTFLSVAVTRFVDDRRHALFRRRAVLQQPITQPHPFIAKRAITFCGRGTEAARHCNGELGK